MGERGSTSGTRRVKDIRAGAFSSFPTIFTTLAGDVIFTANDGTNGTELWKSDGTPSVYIHACEHCFWKCEHYVTVNAIENVNGIVYFTAADSRGNELWRTDGTTAGTFLFADLNTGSGSSNPNSLQNIDGRLFFKPLIAKRTNSAFGYPMVLLLRRLPLVSLHP